MLHLRVVKIELKDHGYLRMYAICNNNHMFWRALSKFLKHLVHFIKAFGGINSTGSLNWTHYPRIVLAVSNACFLHVFIWWLKSCDRFQCHCPTAMSMYLKKFGLLCDNNDSNLYLESSSFKTMKPNKFSSHFVYKLS